MRPYKILIVEDDPPICELISLTLSAPNHALTTADSGASAIAQMVSDKPDLVVLDILIPEPDGWKVYETMRNDPSLSQTRVIILTALPISPGVLASRNLLPADRFMKKPFDLDELRSNAESLLSESEAQDFAERRRTAGYKA